MTLNVKKTLLFTKKRCDIGLLSLYIEFIIYHSYSAIVAATTLGKIVYKKGESDVETEFALALYSDIQIIRPPKTFLCNLKLKNVIKKKTGFCIIIIKNIFLRNKEYCQVGQNALNLKSLRLI